MPWAPAAGRAAWFLASQQEQGGLHLDSGSAGMTFSAFFPNSDGEQAVQQPWPEDIKGQISWGINVPVIA